MAQQEFQQIFPQPGWVEHDPSEIWSSQLQVLNDALTNAGIGAQDLAAIGITNQRETAVVWERQTGKPLCNAIVWQDRRTATICDDLKARDLEGMIRDKTGLVIDAYFSATKWKWILDNVPGAGEKARRGELAFGTVDSWLIWNLTGGKVHVTDVTNASPSFWICLGFPGVSFRKCVHLLRSTGIVQREFFRSPYLLPGSPGISRQPLSGRCACRPGL